MIGLNQQLEMLEFKRYRSRKQGKRRGGYFDDAANETELNLVAMMDMLTILLVFLLKSYSVSSVSIPAGGGELSMPVSSNNINPKDAVKLTISATADGINGVIVVEDTPVVTLLPEKVKELRARADKRQYMIEEVNTRLIKEANAIQKMAELTEDVKFDHKIMLIADKSTPYWLITSVLYSAAEAGFDQYNLVAIRRDQ